MNISAAGIALLHMNEDCKLTAYRDTAGIWTIGWGTTRYPEGDRVQQGDTCTQDQADLWFRDHVRGDVLAVDGLTVDSVSQRQFDALCSFAYNAGRQAYQGSTLRKKVNINPQDPSIRSEFMKWHYIHVRGNPRAVRSKGLWNRRHREADFYFGVRSPTPRFPG